MFFSPVRDETTVRRSWLGTPWYQVLDPSKKRQGEEEWLHIEWAAKGCRVIAKEVTFLV